MKQNEIVRYCDELLRIEAIKDFCPNGLQVEGDDREVKTVALGVSISMEFIQKAMEVGADMIMTHHGLIWDKNSRRIQGPFRKKVMQLLNSGIAAVSYHLPLDFHPELGNNVQLAQTLELKDLECISDKPDLAEAVSGKTACSTIEELAELIESKLSRKPMILPFGREPIEKVLIMTGGAQGYYLTAIEQGADCFITGEISELNYAMSQEYELHFVSAGHYATEKWGILALGNRLSETFGLHCRFIEIDNPI